MKQVITESSAKQTQKVFRVAYLLFLMLVVFYLVRGDVENATINLGIALIFDPFDARVVWNNRPVYQRVWLITHVLLTLGGFVYLIAR